MVDVSVGKNYRIEIFYRKGQLAVFVGRFLTAPLKHSTVESDGIPIYVQKVA